MPTLNLDSHIQYLKGVGPKMAENLGRLEIKNPSDLLHHFPRSYVDYQNPSPIRSLAIGQPAVIYGELEDLSIKRSPRKWMSIVEFEVKDQSGRIKIIYFNQPYLKDTFKEGEKLYFYGKVGFDFQARQKSLASPLFSLKPSIYPIYPETKSVTSKYLSKLISTIIDLAEDVEEFLPLEVINETKILPLAEALKKIHQPNSLIEVGRARDRLTFQELYLTSLTAQLFRRELKRKKAESLEVRDEDLVSFVASLKFKLTNAQKKAAWEIISDLKTPQPMNRLLNGDVGSGKTVVAAMAIYAAFKAGKKSILMAPTEILANQHFETLSQLFKPFKIKVGLLTSASKKDHQDFDLLIGTHALLYKESAFNDVALVVIDEQHRFGVEQRKLILEKSHQDDKNAHLLSMTATPIPRTLQLTLYGDLDVSIIDELPPGRQKIESKVYGDRERQLAYDLIRSEIKAGRQAFVICPLIEESQSGDNLLDLDRKSVIMEHKKLKEKIFPALKIGLMHGKLKSREKAEVMSEFANRNLDILVSTSVVEVGVDIPNATVIMIEDAERFGLAQLHQFRGRVGRSRHKAYCFLMTQSLVPKVVERLTAMENNNSGFKLAEIDLKLRGAGQLYGREQSGYGDLRLEWLSDIFLLEEARDQAAKTLKLSPNLTPQLRTRLGEKINSVHLE